MGKQIKSDEMLIRVDVRTQKVTCQYTKNNVRKNLPKVGDRDPDDNEEIVLEPHTGEAKPIQDQVRIIKWHHHSPDCITVEIGGAQYQVCT
jgi:hypothetical protein